MTGRITVNTDASFCPKYKIGAFAFWIKSDQFTLKQAGAFKDYCIDPNECEMKAIYNAVLYLLKSGHLFLDFYFVFNTDSKRAIERICNPDEKDELGLKINSTIQKLNAGNIKFRWVKGHSGVKDKRSFVNEWCDTHAKAAMRKKRNELKQQ